MTNRLKPCLWCLIYSVWLLLVVCTAVEAAQQGRITEEVNFRQGPSQSTSRIGRLPAGAEVEIITRQSNGWYEVIYRGQKGFVHPNYIAVETGKTRARLGATLMVLGGVLVTLYFIPMLSRLAILLIASVSAVLLLDIGFSFGVLYSLVCVSLSLLIALLVLKAKEKPKPPAVGACFETERKAT